MALRLTSSKLKTVNTGFKATFQRGLSAVTQTNWGRVATFVPSDTKEEEYGWLKDIPQIREWVGDRVINALAADGYKIKNRPFELTIAVDRDDMDDDRLGVYAPRFELMGDEVGRFPDRLVFGQLPAGFATLCFDGQYFFDTDHPVLDANGATVSVSNMTAGAGTPWYLLCTKKPIKPLIYQLRRAFEFVAMDNPDDERAFMKKELTYGVDGRANAGYGLWQLAHGSRATLDATNFKAARASMRGMKGDFAKPLSVQPDLLVVPASLQDQAEELILKGRLANGEDNPLFKTVEILVSDFV